MKFRFLRKLRVEITSFFEDEELGEEEVNLRTLSIIFLLGLLLLFGIYSLSFDEARTVYNAPSNIYHKLVGSYSKLINSIQNSAMGKTETIDDSYKTISCKDCKINTEFKIDQDKKILIVDYELSHRNNLWRQIHKIFERIFEMPIDFGWVQIKKDLDYADWGDYTTMSLSIKGTGKPSNLDFSIVEEDGDAWYYFDKTSLASEEWVEIRMPFEDFINPGWAGHGDGKKEFKNITRIELTITNFDEPVKNTLSFEMFDDELFNVI